MKKRKILSLLLCAAMLITQAVPAYADETAVPAADEAAALPYGFKGMPAGYSDDAEDNAVKADAEAAVSALAGLVPGVDYVSDEIVYLAESESEAKKIAEAYNADLFKYQYGVATAYLRGGATVAQAVEVGAVKAYNMPLVSPDYITALEEPELAEAEVAAEPVEAPEAPEQDSVSYTTWEEWTDILDDPALDPSYVYNVKSAVDPDGNGTPTRCYQWMHENIGVYEAWAATRGSRDITVAVIDTGIDDQHEDLIGHSVNLTDVVDLSYQQYKTDENGHIVYDENGQPIIETITPEALDASGHGTHVAGIIAASAGNGLGGTGIAPGVSLIGLPVFIDSGKGYSSAMNSTLMAALLYVAGYEKDGSKGEPKANIINMSLGSHYYTPGFQQVIDAVYESGVTICAAMGNTYTNSMHFPAAYDHVIGVCATARDDQRSFFSTYGSWADIAAPGSTIFSTWNGHDTVSGKFITEDHHDWYTIMSGTSMACPVVAGACALYMSAAGAVSPDTMEAVLKKSATKLSDKTLSVGLVNVAAMMPDSADKAVADTPLLYAKDYIAGTTTEIKDSAVFEGNQELYVNVPDNVAAKQIILTFDGKDPTYKNGKAGKNCTIISADSTLSLLTKAGLPDTFTLKAAYISLKGTLGKIKSVNVTLKHKQKSEQELYIQWDAPQYVAVGKTAQYSARLLYEDLPSDRNIVWSVSGAPAGVSIDKNGKLKVGKGVSKGTTFTVKATAADFPDTYREITVTVISPITEVRAAFREDSFNEAVNAPARDKKGIIKSVRMYTEDMEKTPEIIEDMLILNPEAIGFELDAEPEFMVTSSNESVVTPAGNTLLALSPGKAKITVAAMDGSGKKATFDVNVVVPASDLSLVSAGQQSIIGFGKSAKLQAVLGSAYGTPTVTDVNWDYSAFAIFSSVNGEKAYEDLTELFKDKKLVTIDKKGKVTVNKKAESALNGLKEKTVNGVTYYPGKDLRLTVFAATADGTGHTANFTYALAAPTSALYIVWPDSTAYSISAGNVFYAIVPIGKDGNVTEASQLTFRIVAEGLYNYGSSASYSVSSSDPSSGSPIISGFDSNYGAVMVTVIINKQGYSKITVAANDGSGKKIDIHIVSYGVVVEQ
ncbi:MAG: S8 family serine peptidase [Ruminiclostridium sp.]|nr:S8 family serine peptidase [Ruminiclostridium sp.]